MSHAKSCLAILLVSSLAACGDSTAPDSTRNDIRGVVVDTNGRPAAGATVVLQYSIDPPSAAGAEKAAVIIRFLLPVAGPVSIWISSTCDADTVRRLITADMPAGEYSVVWDGRDDQGRLLPDGAYWSHLVTMAGDVRNDLLLLRFGFEHVADDDIPAPLTVTDSAGRFTLDQGCLSFGHTYTGTDESGNPTGSFEVSRSVRVWAFSAADSSRAASNWTSVDPHRGAEVGIVLGR
jgi:hypothetical protein